MKKSSLLLPLLAMLVCSFVLYTLANAEWSSLPEDVKVVLPAPDVPQKLAQFSGIWEGTWQGKDFEKGLQMTLVIEKIKPSQSGGFELIAFYSLSNLPEGEIFMDIGGKWMRFTIAVPLPAANDDFKIVFDTSAARLEFMLNAKDQMRGVGTSFKGKKPWDVLLFKNLSGQRR
jgi:hypothetical protein